MIWSRPPTWPPLSSPHINISPPSLIIKVLTLVLLQVAVAVGVGEPVFLQVSPDAEPRPLRPPLSFQLGLVQRVRHREDSLPVGLRSGAAAVGRGRHVGGGRSSLRVKRSHLKIKHRQSFCVKENLMVGSRFKQCLSANSITALVSGGLCVSAMTDFVFASLYEKMSDFYSLCSESCRTQTFWVLALALALSWLTALV